MPCDPAEPWGRIILGLCLSTARYHEQALIELRYGLACRGTRGSNPVSLQRRVGANFQFLSGGLNRSVPVGRAPHDDIRGATFPCRAPMLMGRAGVRASVGT